MASKKVVDEGFDIAKNIANDVMNAIKGKTEDAVKAAPKKIVVAPKVVAAPVAKVKPAPKVKVEPAVEPDWGFQPKPNEVSGTRAIEALYSHDTPGIRVGIDPVKKVQAKKDWEQFKTQIDTAVNKNKLPKVDTRGNYEYEQIADNLAGLESAGVPREHTGEILRMLDNPNLGSKKVGYKTYNYNILTKDLQKLSSKEERSLYLSMLPQWDDTRQSLVKFVKSDTALQAKDAAREAANKAAKAKPLEKTIADEVSAGMTKPKVEAKPVVISEMSGNDAVNSLYKIDNSKDPYETSMAYVEFKKFGEQLFDSMKNKKLPQLSLAPSSVEKIAKDFKTLEDIKVPKNYIEKIYKALHSKYDSNEISNTIGNIAKALKSLDTTQQREEFIKLIPEWDQSFEELAQTVKLL